MLEGKGTVLNDLEKKSFYSFLTLYIGSSFLFLLLSGFWYYKAQKNSLENTTYYKMQHDADTISGLVINAQMHNVKLKLPKLQKGYEYYLIKTDENQSFEKNYFKKDGYTFLISNAPREHLHVKYVVIKTDEYHQKLKEIQIMVLSVMFLVFVAIVLILWMLAKLFMKPIHQKMMQIEQFIRDITHELNTPITALKMSSQRALQKGMYDEKILKNISISTKQLYTIYNSLTYLNFSNQAHLLEKVNLKEVLEEIIEYYDELCHAKKIDLILELEDALIEIDKEQAKLLFSNLLSNALKYSMPNKSVTMKLREGSFFIQDEGVGIAKEKLEKIFQLYERSSNIAGGFGMGLSIVKHICDMFGIKIRVKSEVGKGSIFRLSW